MPRYEVGNTGVYIRSLMWADVAWMVLHSENAKEKQTSMVHNPNSIASELTPE